MILVPLLFVAICFLLPLSEYWEKVSFTMNYQEYLLTVIGIKSSFSPSTLYRTGALDRRLV